VTAEPLSLSRLYGRTFQLLWRDAPLIAVAWLPLCAAGIVSAAGLEWLMHDAGPSRPTAEVLPWMVESLPSFIADAAVVWVALRRLRGGRGPALGGWRGAAMMLGAVIAIDLVENVPDLAQTLAPAWATDPLQPFYDLGVLLVMSVWTALWLPAVAVAVDERKGGPTSLGRGLALATGHFSMLTTFALSVYIVGRLLTLVIAYGFNAAGYGATPGWVVDLIVLPVGAFGSVSQAVVYWELTRLKTGLTPAGAAEVFS